MYWQNAVKQKEILNCFPRSVHYEKVNSERCYQILSHHYSGMEHAVVWGTKPYLALGVSSFLHEQASVASQVIKHRHKLSFTTCLGASEGSASVRYSCPLNTGVISPSVLWKGILQVILSCVIPWGGHGVSLGCWASLERFSPALVPACLQQESDQQVLSQRWRLHLSGSSFCLAVFDLALLTGRGRGERFAELQLNVGSCLAAAFN